MQRGARGATRAGGLRRGEGRCHEGRGGGEVASPAWGGARGESDLAEYAADGPEVDRRRVLARAHEHVRRTVPQGHDLVRVGAHLRGSRRWVRVSGGWGEVGAGCWRRMAGGGCGERVGEE